MKIVKLVHEELRSKFGLEDGLADTSSWADVIEKNIGLTLPLGASADSDFVQILDPATGTGTFLVEVIELIYTTLKDKWHRDGCSQDEISHLWNEYVPKHLLTRLYAYELLMAPFAIAHLKIGLKLHETGYKFKDVQRAGIFLTNALEPKLDFSDVFDFAGEVLAKEVNEANRIKENHRFTVVIGNPPYSNFGQLNRSTYILNLLKDYKKDLTEKKINLDDDFIKFMRFAQSLIEMTGSGVIGMITNNVFLDGITHRAMRKNLMECFSEIKILDLHGNVSAQEVADDGSTDENVFDITQGVCISLLSKRAKTEEINTVSFLSLRGNRNLKYEKLLSSKTDFQLLSPRGPYYFFTPKDFSLEPEYTSFISLSEVFKVNSYGIQTKRDSLTIAFEADQVLNRARYLLNNSDEVVRKNYSLPADGRDWTITLARKDLQRHPDLSSFVRQILYRPFDIRWTLYTGKTKGFLGYPRWSSMKCMLNENLGLIAMRQVFQDMEVYSHFGVSNSLIDERTFYSNRGGTYLFPLFLSPEENPNLLSEVGDARESNFTSEFLTRLAASLGDVDKFPLTPLSIFHYLYACCSSLEYRIRYKEFLKVDFPRVPLIASRGLFNDLSKLGSEIIDIQLDAEYRMVDSKLSFAGETGFVIGKCRWDSGSIFLGEDESNRFDGVSKEIWNFNYGGYQVLNKWLKDRRGEVLTDELKELFLSIGDRLNQSIFLMSQIDNCIMAKGGWPGAFS
jgi:predicted helicase